MCAHNLTQLSGQYLQGCSAPQQCWAMIGTGVRMAQDVGAHRRKYNLDSMAVEDEMWKRAFWYVPFLSPGCSYIVISLQGSILSRSYYQLITWTPLCSLW